MAKTTSGNISYVVSTPGGEYVLRTLVRQSPEGAIQERRIQQVLNQNGIRTPLFLQTTTGGIVAKTGDGDNFVLSKLIPGSKQPEDSLQLAGDMGATLAKMHTLLLNTRISFNKQQWFNPKNAEYQLSGYAGPDKAFISEQTKKYSAVLKKGLPQSLIHGDFHTNNIFSANDVVTVVFDFESAENTVRILDIARLYLTYVKVTNLKPDQIIRVIIKGYNKGANSPLRQIEMQELVNAFIYVALVSSVSIHNHGNDVSSKKYLKIAKELIKNA